MPEQVRKILRILGITLLVLIFAGITGFVVWGLTPAGPMPEALPALESDPQVNVTEGRWLVFTPASGDASTGLIIYPGAHVDYRSYAPAAHRLAAEGFRVIIVKMPLSLAVLNPGAAADVISNYPEIEHWALAGHSLGGAMAANFVKSQPAAAAGLVLWAAYPAEGDDLSGSALKAASISGTLDGLATPSDIAASHQLLPLQTLWVAIDGGNHAQFGWYGDQSGDNPASISREQQQDQIVQATLKLLESIP